MIKITKSLLIILIALNFLEQFFILLFLAIAHEMGHMAMAFFLGERPKKITLTVLGPIGFVENFENISDNKKIAILLAGPIVSLILIFTFKNNHNLMGANLVILLFNLLPIYPLDGGQIFFIIMSKRIGMLNANILSIKIAKIFLVFIYILGVIQMTLFLFNPSLIVLSLYLNKKSKEYYIKIYYSFFKKALGNVAKLHEV